jgi:PTH1 family peptidyl-tRNA hydrolase
MHAIFMVDDVKIHVVQLPTYMNLSGQGLFPYLKFYNISPQRVIIAHDELDLPFGQIRLKKGGGSGGHNGLKDLTHYLKTPDYWRIRLGIGRPPEFMTTADFVLSSFNAQEKSALPDIFNKVTQLLSSLAILDVAKIQLRWHTQS